MATTTKRQTWQELEQRGAPYTPEEMRVLYDRPGMTPVGGNAWRCDSCGRMVGTYTSAQLDAFYRERGTFTDKPAATPPQEIQDMEARLVHCEQVWRDVGQKLGEAYTELARLTQQERDAEAAAGSPRGFGQSFGESATDKAFRRARMQEVNGRIAQLKDAQREALEVRNEASNEFMYCFAQWREQVRQEEERANREAAGLTPEQEAHKPNALERFLSGKL